MQRPALLHAALISLFLSVSVLTGSIFVEQVYDRVMIHKQIVTLIILFIILVAQLVVAGVLSKLRDAILERVGLNIDAELRPALFSVRVRAAIGVPKPNARDGLDDLDTLRGFIGGTGVSALYDALPIPIYLAVCFAIHNVLGLFAASAVAIVAFLGIYQTLLRSRRLLVPMRAAAKTLILADTYKNIEAVQALGMRAAFRARWVESHERDSHSNILLEDHLAIIKSITNFLTSVLAGLCMGVGAYLAINNEISPGNVVGVMLIANKLLQPISQFIGELPSFMRARQAYGRLQILFRAADGAGSRMSLPRPEGRLDVSSLAVTAPGTSHFILSQVSFSLPAGTVTAVVGPSGAGKSTLVRCLIGIWAPSLGTVRLDGSELQHWEADALGQHLGYLPQSVELLSGTIAQNIARFGRVDDAAVLAAAQLAGVHEVIQQLPQGYGTDVGEGGSALSGGQRQRIGLARAIYGDPALVVLDEPNSNLDALGEAALAQALEVLKGRGTTCVLITHKANVLTLADYILVLKDGTVSRFGTRDEVLTPRESVWSNNNPSAS
ncbi:type I secretion system permease/ATPase [Methylobacterium sp. SyP6R]|uniref:type I secretion system permease/ATPase n=1 Tax=Methylobacterium sp. SyP6R TaxID=2718876 RepID=UPI001F01A105|nr:type I secretion system permease/ATPase [Methylobacterium sp. SyP6R]MCF4130237.1 type I secretion system permease/ATPase [Methylobacterium sp. SyP6R]